MDKLKEEKKSPERNKEWIISIAKTQQQGFEEAEQILEDILYQGITSVDIEYRDDICYDIEALIDYYMPNVLRSYRHLFSILFNAEDPQMHPKIIAHINYLLVLVERAKEYLKQRTEGAGPDMDSVIEAHIGHMWRNLDLLDYKLYEENSEIVQLSFTYIKDEEKRTLTDKAYWFNLNTHDVGYTYRVRPLRASRFVKGSNSEFDVLQLERLFVYPGKVNKRIRWGKAGKRGVTPTDIACIHEYAKTDYTEVVNTIKESFRDSLSERNPAVLIRLHKAFLSDEHLILEDERGGLLTVADMPEDHIPTSELLRTILPSQPLGWALLAQVNDDVNTDLFSVKPLSVITPDRIIRLLY